MNSRQMNDYVLVQAGQRTQRLAGAAQGSSTATQGRKDWRPVGSHGCRFGCADASLDGRARAESILRAPVVRRYRGDRHPHVAINNLFPIVEGHLIVTPLIDGELRHVSHELDAAWGDEFWSVARQLEPDQLLGFNSPHAGASVDHLHFQILPSLTSLAIANRPVVRFGAWRLVDQDPRFSSAIRFDLGNEGDRFCFGRLIAQFKAEQVPYNLLSDGKGLFAILRDAERELVREYPGGVIAFAEYAGLVPALTPEFYHGASADLLDAAIRKTSLSRDQTLDLLARVELGGSRLTNARGLVLAGGSSDSLSSVTDGGPKALAPLPLGGVVVDGPFACLERVCGVGSTFVVTQSADRDHWHAQRRACLRIELHLATSRLATLAWAAAIAAGHDPTALIVAAPADHVLAHPERMAVAIERAAECARERDVVALLGVRRRAADAGLGYLLSAADSPIDTDLPRVFTAADLIEKPAAVRAEVLLERGAWANSGVLVARAAVLLGELRQAAPEVAQLLDALAQDQCGAAALVERLAAIPADLNLEGFLAERLAPAGKLLVVESRHDFSDVGSVASYVKAVGKASGADNFAVGAVSFQDCQNVRAYHSRETPLHLTRVRNLLVVSTAKQVTIESMPEA